MAASRRFEMLIAKVPEIFNGDGCRTPITDPHRQPARRAAIIEIVCRRCVPVDAPDPHGAAEFGKVCSVSRTDDCTLRVVLALPCPPRQLIYAPNLDVGTTPHGSQLFAAGAPASCQLSPGGSGSSGSGDGGAPMLAWEAGGSQDHASTLYASLTHGTLAVRRPELAFTSPALAEECSVSLEAGVPLLRGGVLRASDGAIAMRIRCTCGLRATRSFTAAPPLRINLTLRMRVPEFTSPMVSFPHVCDAA